MEGKGARQDAADIKRPRARRRGRGQTRLDEERQRERGREQNPRPNAHGAREPEPRQQGLEHERQHDAPEPGRAPHDAVRHALAPDEPLFDVQNTWAVRHTPADAEKHALIGDELRHRRAEGAQSHGERGHEQAGLGRPARVAGIQAAEGYDYWRSDVHGSLSEEEE